MKNKLISALLAFVAAAAMMLPGCNTSTKEGLDALHTNTQQQLEHLYELSGAPFLELIDAGNEKQLQAHFLECRRQYKQIELGVEYFMPGTARGINGAALPEVEAEEHKENEPTGLQVVETFLYPAYDTANKAELVRAVKNMHAMFNRARQIWAVTTPNEQQWIDAAYFELIRIGTMGITGFDTPACLTGIAESKIALHSVITVWKKLNGNTDLPAGFAAADNMLASSPGFDGFDRAAFLRTPWQQAFEAVAKWRLQRGLLMSRQAVKPTATSLFGNDVLNLDFFVPDSTQQLAAKTKLGEQLFYDARLSSNGKFSCATCHQPEKYFADQLALSDNIHGNKLARNTPSLVNAAFQTAYFWDMRVLNLEMQAKAVIDNGNEMHGSLEKVTENLNKDMDLVAAFRKAYANDTLRITPAALTSVLAAYQRTLVDFNSPFDAYMKGDVAAINQDAKAGFNLFMGKAKCATCHFPPTFAGLVPPYFDKMESEIIGVPKHADNKSTDPDEGRYVIHPVEAFRHAFKTPTVRNVEHTFPYMHNGVYHTLEQVVDFYNKGGGAGLGLDIPNQTLPFDSLQLSAAEQQQLVKFMQSLTGKPLAGKKEFNLAKQ